jgi:tRNA threonylcarbamoyladenosine biosynthesis protein TsaE
MVPRDLQISYSYEELPTVAERLWQWGHSVRVWTFSGNLGAGKTALIRTLCAHIGVKDRVSSPTFALVNEYVLPNGAPVYHMDWYRIQSADEGVEAGLEDAMATDGALSLIEWPEQAPELLQTPHIRIEIETTGPETRSLQASRH